MPVVAAVASALLAFGAQTPLATSLVPGIATAVVALAAYLALSYAFNRPDLLATARRVRSLDMTAGRLDTAGPVLFLVGSERSGTTLLRLMLDHHPEIAFEKEFDFVVSKVSDIGACPQLDAYLEWLATVRGADYAIEPVARLPATRERLPAPEAGRLRRQACTSARRCIGTSTGSGSSGRTLDTSTSYAIRATCPARWCRRVGPETSTRPRNTGSRRRTAGTPSSRD